MAPLEGTEIHRIVHDNDCPKCNVKNSLSVFEKTSFLVKFKDYVAYTKLITFYTCNKCGHAYAAKGVYQAEYDATLLALKNRAKKKTHEDRFRNLSYIIAAALIPLVTLLFLR